MNLADGMFLCFFHRSGEVVNGTFMYPYHLTTGVVSTAVLFKVLSAINETELGLNMVSQTDYPSYGNNN